MKKLIVLLLVFVFLTLTPVALAQNKNTFPAVSNGPGFILPDSPVYFVDNLYQEIKLVLALTPEKRAVVRNEIVGERMAELRVMHARGSNRGISTVLYELSRESKELATDLKEAQLAGRDVTKIAKSINDSLRANRQILAVASAGSSDELSLKLDSANESLLIAKVNVEDYLNPMDFEGAVDEDLEDEVETAVLGIETEAENADKKLEKLEKRAQIEAEKEAKKALQEEKLESQKTQIKEMIQEKKEAREKRKKILEERKKKFQEARAALKKSKEASKKVKEAKKSREELKKISPVPTVSVAQ